MSHVWGSYAPSRGRDSWFEAHGSLSTRVGVPGTSHSWLPLWLAPQLGFSYNKEKEEEGKQILGLWNQIEKKELFVSSRCLARLWSFSFSYTADLVSIRRIRRPQWLALLRVQMKFVVCFFPPWRIDPGSFHLPFIFYSLFLPLCYIFSCFLAWFCSNFISELLLWITRKPSTITLA